MSYCFLCKELEDEDEVCKNLKCIFVKQKIKTLGINKIYKCIISLYHK